MKLALALVCLMLAFTTSRANVVRYFAAAEAAGRKTVRADTSPPASPANDAIMAYDNYTGPGAGGRTIRRGEFRTGNRVIRDDIESVSDQSRLSAYYLVFANMSSQGQLLQFSYELSFTTSSGDLLGTTTFTLDLSLFPLPENSTGVLLWEDGAFTGLDIVLPRTFNVHQRLFDPVGIEVGELGMSYGGPRTVGNSDDGVFDETEGRLLDFGDDSTLRFLIRSDPIPAPGVATLVLCAFTASVARRRR